MARNRHVVLQEAVAGVGKHALGCPWLPLEDQMWIPQRKIRPDPDRVTIHLPPGPFNELGFSLKSSSILGRPVRGTLVVSKIRPRCEWFKAEMDGQSLDSWHGGAFVGVGRSCVVRAGAQVPAHAHAPETSLILSQPRWCTSSASPTPTAAGGGRSPILLRR